MPLCGIISSECLGTLPGAWAKQCGNVLEVNAWEWLWGTAWAASARALQRIRNELSLGRPASWKLGSAGALSPFLTHTFFFILRFLLIVAECPLSPPAKKKKKQTKTKNNTSRYTQVGLSKQAPTGESYTWWCSACQLGLGDENISANQTWELGPVNKSSKTVAWQKQSVNIPNKGASLLSLHLPLKHRHPHKDQTPFSSKGLKSRE